MPPETVLDQWRSAALIAAQAKRLGMEAAIPGASLRSVAETIEQFIRSRGAEPAFPANLSRNEEAAHFTPGREDTGVLNEGDLLKVDVGAHVDGAIADTAASVEVGGARRHERLIQAANEALAAGIARVRAGVRVDEVSRAIEAAVHRRGLKPVENLTGHSIERYLLHAGKSIPNVSGMTGEELRAGEIIAIEPFATNGRGRIANGKFGNILRFRSDPADHAPELSPEFQRFRTLPFTLRWVDSPEARERIERRRRWLQTYPVFVEEDRGLVAQAEHTVLVTPDGAEVLTEA